MRRERDAGINPKGVARRQGLCCEDIQYGMTDRSVFKRIEQVIFNQVRTPGEIDQLRPPWAVA